MESSQKVGIKVNCVSDSISSAIIYLRTYTFQVIT